MEKAKTKAALGLVLRGVGVLAASLAVSTVLGQSKDIYPATTAAGTDLQAALAKANTQHKRVILDFGGNWCGDCRALNAIFHKSPNAALLANNFILVDINIGRVDQNLDIAKKYEVPLGKGVPALAVLDSNGHLLYSQKNGEFEAMRSMDPTSVTKFLNQWKAPAGDAKK